MFKKIFVKICKSGNGLLPLSLKHLNMELIGTVLYIDPTKDVSKKEGENFFVRTFGIQTKDTVNFQEYKYDYGFQATQDACKMLDAVNIGDKIKVDFGIKGNLTKVANVEGTEKNPESKVVYMTLKANDVTVLEKIKVEAPDSFLDDEQPPFVK